MKAMKKFSGLLLAMLMVLTMAVTVFAAGTGKITVNNTVSGQTYTIYRLFDLESYAGSGKDDAHSYKVADAWDGYFTEGAEGRDYFDVDKNGYVTAKANMDAAEFAKKALSYAETNAISQDGQIIATDTTVTFENLKLGYYLVDSSVGALCSLTTTDADAEVIEKNGAPTLVKKVQEGDAWGEKNDANVGDTVNFQATITVQGFAKDYVMHDTMSTGLTFGAVTSVKKNGTELAAADYTVVTENLTDGCTFEVKFTETFCNTLQTGDEIVVSYNATVNENAVVAKTGNSNKAVLKYKDNNNADYSTTESETHTFTWEIPVLKYANGDEKKVLSGAKFSLYKDAACTESVKFADNTNNVYKVNATGSVSEITTDTTGKFTLEGLDAGTYYLKETESPAGYNKLNTVVKVVIDHEGKITVDNSTTTTDTVKVENKSGTKLPETGGIGTTIFYVLGSVLVLGSAVLLIAKKRMGSNQ